MQEIPPKKNMNANVINCTCIMRNMRDYVFQII